MKITFRRGRDQSHTILLLGAVILSVLWWYLSVYEHPITNASSHPDNTAIVVFGNSIAAGVGSLRGSGFAGILETDLHITIDNISTSTADVYTDYQFIRDTIDLHPRVVILAFNSNDPIFVDIPPELVRSRIESTIQRIHNHGSAVLLLEMPGYGSLYRKIARKHNTGFVPNILSGLSGNELYMSDHIHPNDAGYQIIANRIQPELAKLLR